MGEATRNPCPAPRRVRVGLESSGKILPTLVTLKADGIGRTEGSVFRSGPGKGHPESSSPAAPQNDGADARTFLPIAVPASMGIRHLPTLQIVPLLRVPDDDLPLRRSPPFNWFPTLP
jgi:hypothetical protein